MALLSRIQIMYGEHTHGYTKMEEKRFSRTDKLTPEEMEAKNKRFLELQKEYNETQNKNILWFQMMPLLEDACKAQVTKMNGIAGFIPNYDEKVETALFLLIKRYTKNPSYNYGSLPTLAYWAALYASRNKAIQEKDKQGSFDDLIVDGDLYESEHIIGFDDSLQSSVTEIDEEEYIIEDLY